MKKLFLLLPIILLVFMPNSIEAKNYVIKGVSYPEPEAIDLGLPSGNKWANMNIGASSVNEIGGYYGWADPTGELTVDDYNWRSVTLDGAWTSPLFGGTNPPRDISGSELDIATNKLGAEWCMPSSDDFKELTDNCSFVVESQFVRVTGPNGNSIILPISGMWIWSHQGGGQDASRWKYMQEMTSYPCFWVSTRSFYNHDDSDYWAQYNQPAADYAHADANGFWGADGTCDSWYRNGMIPIRAIKRGKNDAGYVEVCGIKWAKGNLQYDEVNGGNEKFMTNWRLAPYQWHYYNYADGYGQQTYDQWDDQIDHFNWGVCGPNALSIYDYAKIGNARIFTGKMYTDEACTNECTDFSMAKYGDIAYWASKGVYRTPTMEEYHTIGDNASISFGYCVSPDNKKVYGCLFTTPNGERIIETQEREFTSEDLNKGLFLPFNATRLNPQATDGHNGRLIYFGSEGRYWSSETDGGDNSNVGARSFYIQNWALEEGMDDGVHTLATYAWGQACQGAPIRPVLVNQDGEIVSNNNTLSCLDVQCLVGTTPTLNVVLQNDDEVKLCQFDLQLPEGVTVATKSNGKLDATLTERAENHSISSQRLSNGNYRFIVSSMDNDSFTGNSGTLMEIKLDVSATMEAGEYTMKLLNAELSVPDSNDLKVVKPTDTESKLTVKVYTPGDVNNDGAVSVTDVGCAINYILEQVPSVFVFDAADMNGDNTVSVTDVGMIINLILNEGVSGSRGMAKEDFNNDYHFLSCFSLQAISDSFELQLEDKDAFIGFQFDMELDNCAIINGLQLKGTADSDHLLTYRRLANGKWRVVCYSPTNSTFTADDTALLTISVVGNASERYFTGNTGTATLGSVAHFSDIRLTTAGLDELRPAALVSMPTGIANVEQGMKMSVLGKTLCINSDRDTTLRLLTIGGSTCRILHVHRGQNSFDGLRAGIYMIDNKKIIIR